MIKGFILSTTILSDTKLVSFDTKRVDISWLLSLIIATKVLIYFIVYLFLERAPTRGSLTAQENSREGKRRVTVSFILCRNSRTRQKSRRKDKQRKRNFRTSSEQRTLRKDLQHPGTHETPKNPVAPGPTQIRLFPILRAPRGFTGIHSTKRTLLLGLPLGTHPSDSTILWTPVSFLHHRYLTTGRVGEGFPRHRRGKGLKTSRGRTEIKSLPTPLCRKSVFKSLSPYVRELSSPPGSVVGEVSPLDRLWVVSRYPLFVRVLISVCTFCTVSRDSL